MNQDKNNIEHPGLYIRKQILPKGISVSNAAEKLGIGRSALSNLLNGNAALSQEMATRLEKVFGANKQELLQKQNQYEQSVTELKANEISVTPYVPSFLSIKAKDIEKWAEDNIEARSLLSVLLRKLIHSTGSNLSLVDFPGYDNSQQHGWDGQVKSNAITPWIPKGESLWEFGCDKNVKAKADRDFDSNKANLIPANKKLMLNYICVTPRNWPGKKKWAAEKNNLGIWNLVRVYDASNLEQWLEQSISVQAWFAKQIGIDTEGAKALDDYWDEWADVTTPKLSKELFRSAIDQQINRDKSNKNPQEYLLDWLDEKPSTPFIVTADSKEEALAFLSCLFDSEEFIINGYKDKAIVFSNSNTLLKLSKASTKFISIIFDDLVEREVGGTYKTIHTILVKLRNSIEIEANIELGLLNFENFNIALKKMEIDEDSMDTLRRESAGSPTILRRRLSNYPAIKTPKWSQENDIARFLIPLMFVGAWHSNSKADQEIISFLSDTKYDDVEKQIVNLLKLEDCPVWSIGQYRGVTSNIDVFFALRDSITQKDIEDFFLIAEIVLSESDPALELPERDRWAANIYGKTREHSGAIRDGIYETLIILSTFDNRYFFEKLGVTVSDKVDGLIRNILTPLSENKLHSQCKDLPNYAEASPKEFLSILEDDLKQEKPIIFSLLQPVGSGVFSSCTRSGLLWALESIAWNPLCFPRVCLILARLSEKEIIDNYVNKPINTLLSLFRSWMPQTAASLDQRKVVLDTLVKQFPNIGWLICNAELKSGSRIGHYNYKPKWRTDAIGFGQIISKHECGEFMRTALETALRWPQHTSNTLTNLIECLQSFLDKDISRVFILIRDWAETATDQEKAILRENLRQNLFTRRARNRDIQNNILKIAHEIYIILKPNNLVFCHKWLFDTDYVHESIDELSDETIDYKKREERISKLRINALKEIWKQDGFDGIKSLVQVSCASSVIGFYLTQGVIKKPDFLNFTATCLKIKDTSLQDKVDELLRGFLSTIKDTNFIASVIKDISEKQVLRLLKCAPFSENTWKQIECLLPKYPPLENAYWNEIEPQGFRLTASETNQMVDSLLRAKRPIAAFLALSYKFNEVETIRLKKIIEQVAFSKSEANIADQLSSHSIAEAFKELNARLGVNKDELAALEFSYIPLLEHSDYRIPNFLDQINKSPALFVQIISMAYKRSDNGEDPNEWVNKNEKVQHQRASMAHAFLEHFKFVPGIDEKGIIITENLKIWINKARSLCKNYSRSVIGDQILGQWLSIAPIGNDEIWPCESVREVLEEIGSSDIAIGLKTGEYNSRGAFYVDESGNQEKEIADKYKYRQWSKKLIGKYPYTSELLEQIAQSYDWHAKRENINAKIRRRLGD